MPPKTKTKPERPRTPDEMIRDGLRLLSDEYERHCKTIGDELMELARSGEFGEDGVEQADTWLHEMIDGDGWVVYTQKAQIVCLVSENYGAYIDEFGSEGAVEDGAVQWNRFAYCAMLADVRDYLADHEFYTHDPETWKQQEE